MIEDLDPRALVVSEVALVSQQLYRFESKVLCTWEGLVVGKHGGQRLPKFYWPAFTIDYAPHSATTLDS